MFELLSCGEMLVSSGAVDSQHLIHDIKVSSVSHLYLLLTAVEGSLSVDTRRGTDA